LWWGRLARRRTRLGLRVLGRGVRRRGLCAALPGGLSWPALARSLLGQRSLLIAGRQRVGASR
ncbi:MAG TPA: hypothetical protein VID31_04775, partial [Streptosporangiaceae bacterium]